MFKFGKTHKTWYNSSVDPFESKGKAVLVKMLPPGNGLGKSKFKGLYRLEPPIEWHDRSPDNDEDISMLTRYVVVSAIVAMFSGPETFMFPANSEGEVLNWLELKGSMKGTLDPEEVLANAGYQVVNGIERAREALKEKKE